MDTNGDSEYSTPAGKEYSLPVSEISPASPTINPSDPRIPATLQQNVGPDLDEQNRERQLTKKKEPFPVAIIKDDELSKFEKKSARFGYWGVVIGFLSLGAAGIAAYVVFQQFKEMAAQTEILSRDARRARADSAAAAITTAEQLGIAQKSMIAIQGQLAEAKRAGEIAERPWITVSEAKPAPNQPWVIKSNGEMSGTIQIKIENIGKTLAKDTVVTAKFGGFWFDEVNEQELLKKLCDQKWPSLRHGSFGEILFPGIPFNPDISWSVSGNAKKSVAPAVDYHMPTSIVGCVQYKSPDAKRFYYTGFVYTLIFLSDSGVFAGINVDPKNGGIITVPGDKPLTAINQLAIPPSSIKVFLPPVFGGIAK